MQIRVQDPGHPAVVALLDQHLTDMAQHSPPQSIHALDLSALRAPGITFWAVWQDAQLLGCGALKQLDASHGEIKSMRTAPAHRRRGVGEAMLTHIIAQARQRGHARLSLETGSAPAFAPARRLYARHGFVACGPFADYVEDPYSLFMSRRL